MQERERRVNKCKRERRVNNVERKRERRVNSTVKTNV